MEKCVQKVFMCGKGIAEKCHRHVWHLAKEYFKFKISVKFCNGNWVAYSSLDSMDSL